MNARKRESDDVSATGLSFTGHGDSIRLVEILSFLVNSADHSIQAIELVELSTRFPETYSSLRAALAEDGYDVENRRLSTSMLHMVIGRVERHILIARLGIGEFSQSFIEYVIEGSDLFGRRYRFSDSDVAFLEYEIRTGDSEQVLVTGNTPVLGRWDLRRAFPLEYNGSGRGGHHWLIRIPVVVGETIEFKFVQAATVWERGENRIFRANEKGTTTTSDHFRE